MFAWTVKMSPSLVGMVDLDTGTGVKVVGFDTRFGLKVVDSGTGLG